MTNLSTISVDQLWRTPYVKGVYSELATPDMQMSSFYRMMENRTYTPQRTFGWDLFNLTRTVATMKAPGSAPSTIQRQKIGNKTGALLRVAEKFAILDEEIAKLRPPGAPIGTMDARGEAWFTRQVKNMTQRHKNLLEIMTSRAIQGGFGLARSGEMYYLTELNASGNEFDIDYFQVANDSTCRARHTGDLDGIIDVQWDDPTANIPMQLQKLRQRMLIEYGAMSSVAWTDSITISHMMNNVHLSQIAGSANRVWKSWDMNGSPTKVEPGDRDIGPQRIVFNAIPDWEFIVNDAVVSLGTSSDPQGTDGFTISSAGMTRVVPAGHVLFTPPPSEDWVTCYETDEPVQQTPNARSEMARGFTAWNWPLNQFPPGREANMLDNFLPVIIMPRAIWNATVREPDATFEIV